MVHSMKYFSNKVATGLAFCNRDKERAALVENIISNEHSVVVAPRRYGKTSLVLRAIEEAKTPYAMVDLFCVVYEREIIRKVAKGVAQITGQLMSRTEKAISFLENVFRLASIGFKAGQMEVIVEFSPNKTTTDHIEDLLLGLEKVAAKANKSVVFFIDEFQDLLKVEQSKQVQAAIRSVAQLSQYVSYVFSGSSRYMLEKIFEDRNQPLYMMCHKLMLKRISEEHLGLHLKKASKARWGKELEVAIIEQILKLTECHTYYFNTLCRAAFLPDAPPTVEDIEQLWHEQLGKHKEKIIAELEKLSANRIKVLSKIALLGEVYKPNSQSFLEAVQLSISSTQTSIEYLLDNDYLYRTDKHSLKLVDPLMRLFLVERQL